MNNSMNAETSTINSSAPGKLFLLGEYAVLSGAPALLTPVPQQAQVQLTTGDKTCLLTSETKSMATADALASLPLLKHVVETLREQGLINEALAAPLDEGQLGITLDTSAFFHQDKKHQGVKLGLGSSAALTAALVKALAPPRSSTRANTRANTSTSTLTNAAIDCHLAFQQGVGSGADVALAMTGAPILFRKSVSEKGGSQTITPVTLPPDLFMLFIWSGTPASTRQHLQAAASYQQQQPQAWADAMSELAEISSAGSNILAAGAGTIDQRKTAAFLACVESYDAALHRLSVGSGLGFYTQPHEMLRKQVKSAGCVYKPSGAGGGDFGIAFSSSHERMKNLQGAMQHEGFLTLPHKVG